MEKTYLSKREALQRFAFNEAAFDIILSYSGTRKIGNRVHLHDLIRIEKEVWNGHEFYCGECGRRDYTANYAFFADNDNAGQSVEMPETSGDDENDEVGGLHISIMSF